MANAISIHIGLNGVDATKYNGWAGTLSGCVNDANAMKTIADGLQYSSTLLLNEDATSSAVIQAIGSAAQQLGADDILFISYSGHGGLVDDVTGGESGDAGKDETWVLYDRMVLDDELQQLWGQFATGVRIVVLSDSCHSGTITRDAPPTAYPASPAPGIKPALSKAGAALSPKENFYHMIANSGALDGSHRAAPSTKPPVYRMIPSDVQDTHVQKNRDFYSTRQWAAVSRNAGDTGATVLLISGCQDNQLSSDGDGNGLFTGTMLQVWNNGDFTGNYHEFHSAIVAQMPPSQTPNFFMTGPAYMGFEEQQPFSIDRTSASGAGGNDATGMGRTTTTAQPSRPTVQGPNSAARGGPAPSFTVDAQGNKFYVFEVATDASLFDTQKNGGRRTQDNFYGSWQDDGNRHIDASRRTYALSNVAWSRLCGANCLYYRVVSTSSSSGWDNYLFSTYDNEASQAPSVAITDTQATKTAAAGGSKM